MSNSRYGNRNDRRKRLAKERPAERAGVGARQSSVNRQQSRTRDAGRSTSTMRQEETTSQGNWRSKIPSKHRSGIPTQRQGSVNENSFNRGQRTARTGTQQNREQVAVQTGRRQQVSSQTQRNRQENSRLETRQRAGRQQINRQQTNRQQTNRQQANRQQVDRQQQNRLRENGETARIKPSRQQLWRERLLQRRIETGSARVRQDKNGKKILVFKQFMQVKLAVLYFAILLIFVCLGMRLMYINNKNGENYKKQILSQQEYSSKTLPYKRGEILDKNGTKLAYSEKVYNLVVDSYEINHSKDVEKAKSETLSALSKYFGIDTAKVGNYVETNKQSRYYVVKKTLTYDEITPFNEAKAENKLITGIWFEEEYRRQYPNDSTASKLVGFTGSDNNGTYGLEEFYNGLLNGTNGRQYGYLTEDSTLERTTIPAKDGETLVTSIDVNIQSVVEKYINKFSEDHANEYRTGEKGAKNIGVVVMDPQTGNILAMSDDKQYNLNNPKDLTPFYSQEEISAMDDETTYENLNRIWRNFCISDTYEPGSVAKAMTIAAGLDSGKVTGNETYVCNGVLEVSGHKIKCHKRIGHGTVTVSNALEQSCNVALMHMGEQMGKETLMKYLYAFNIGLKTNIDLSGEARTNTLVYNVEDMVASDTAISTFGQGYNVTMIQMASAFSSIINGGKYYEPHVVTEIQNPDGTVAKKIEPRVLKQTISATTSDRMKEYLANVCTLGTGTTAVPAGYIIGGKTGTAEMQPRGNGQYVVSFMGFAPVDDPKVVVYCVIDRPNAEDQPHSTFAQEVVRNIMTEVLPYMNIFRTEELTDEQKAELEALHILQGENTEEEGQESEGQEGQEGQDGEASEGENQEGGDPEVTYQIDPETGNAIDPNNGEQLNPSTFEPVNGTSSDLDGIEGVKNEEVEDNGDVSADFAVGAWF